MLLKNLSQKKIGIIGFGITGKSVERFLRKYSEALISIWFSHIGDLKNFIEQQDYVVFSPGIDQRPFLKFKDKFINELDLFGSCFKKKSIAITGTLGKTTITTLIHKLIPKSVCGGNIGVGALDLISQQKNFDWAVLELSSFQLEFSSIFAPDIAVLTNFYPNHLDRHKNMEEYFEAKSKIFKYQKEGQILILTKDLISKCTMIQHYLKNYKGRVVFADDSDVEISGIDTFPINLKIVQTVLNQIGVRKQKISLENVRLEHRLEKFKTINGVDFYNDSKATVIESTISAIKKISNNNRPIILILGGTDKGVDRGQISKFIKTENIKQVFVLGDGYKEIENCRRHCSLKDLVHDMIRFVESGDQVLFSPGGASFDYFKNYEERGRLFKELVLGLTLRYNFSSFA